MTDPSPAGPPAAQRSFRYKIAFLDGGRVLCADIILLREIRDSRDVELVKEILRKTGQVDAPLVFAWSLYADRERD